MSDNHVLLIDGSEVALTPLGGPPPTLDAISHSLSYINRFSGHTIRPYSVLEHSLLVYEIGRLEYPGLPKRAYRAMLLHDAAECLTGDVTSPVKKALGSCWKRFEDAVELFVLSGIDPYLPGDMLEFAKQIRRCDLLALATERRDLLNWSKERNSRWFIDNAANLQAAKESRVFNLPRTEVTPKGLQRMRDNFLRLCGETYTQR
jgi:5'-deoxynucleotidase YfbR-like HD superfamily hydrolase